MSDYEVTLVNDNMQEFYVRFHGPTESEWMAPARRSVESQGRCGLGGRGCARREQDGAGSVFKKLCIARRAPESSEQPLIEPVLVLELPRYRHRCRELLGNSVCS